MKQVYFFKSVFLIIALFAFYININAQNCSVNSGVPATYCQTTPTFQLYGGTSGRVINNSWRWRFISGPKVPLISDSTLKIPTITGANRVGVYTFRFLASCETGSNFQDVNITIDTTHAIPVVGPNQTVTCYTGGKIVLNTTGLTIPGSGFRATWTASNGYVSYNSSSGNWEYEPSFDGAGGCFAANTVFTLTYSITNLNNTACVSSNTKTVTINAAAKPFLPGKGNDITLTTPSCSAPTAPYTATGKCPGNGTGTWSIFPSTGITFSPNINARTATIAGISPGQSYRLIWCVNGRTCGSDGCDTLDFTASTAQGVTSAFASTSVSSFCNTIPNCLVLNGNTFGIGETGVWTQTAGAPVTFNTPNSATTSACGFTSNGGPYTFNYRIANSQCATNSTLTITVESTSPVFSAIDRRICVPYGSSVIGANSCTNTNALSSNVPLPASSSTSIGTFVTPISWPSNASIGSSGYPPPNGILIYQSNGCPFVGFWARNNVSFGSGQPASSTTSGAYSVNVGVTNSCGTTNKLARLYISLGGAPTNAGTDQILPCGDTFTQLAGSVLNGANWRYLDKFPNTGADPFFVSRTDTAYPDVAGLLFNHSYRFIYYTGEGPDCPPRADTMTVFVARSSPPQAVILSDSNFCHSPSINLRGNMPVPGIIGSWSILSGPSGASIVRVNDSVANLINTTANSNYSIMYSLRNSCGITYDTTTIRISSTTGPSNAIARADFCLGAPTFVLSATAPTSGTGRWSFFSGPSIVTFSSATNPGATSFGFNNAGNYKLLWSVSVPGCQTNVDTLYVTRRIGTITASPSTSLITICNSSLPATRFIQGNSVAGYTPSWTIVGGDSRNLKILNPNSDTTTIVVLSEGDYTIRYMLKQGVCEFSSNVTVVAKSTPSAANAGRDTIVCGSSNPFRLRANNPTSGYGYWTIDSGAGVQFVPSSQSVLYNANVSANPGITRLKWVVTAGGLCDVDASYDYMYINYVPLANAGTDINLCKNSSMALRGNNPGVGYGNWSKVSGSGTQPELPSPNLIGSVPYAISGLDIPQSYTFRYTITSPVCPTTSDDIIVNNDSLSVIPNIGIDDTLCYSSGLIANLTSNISATPYTKLWSKFSGPSRGSFIGGNSNSNANFGSLDSGLYIFRFTATYLACSMSDFINVRVPTPPVKPNITIVAMNPCSDTISVNSTSAYPNYRYNWSFEEATNTDTSGVGLYGPIQNQWIWPTDTSSKLIKLTYTNLNTTCSNVDSVRYSINCVALPVNFLTFEVEKINNNSVKLIWQTNHEINAKYYEIERSIDGINFVKIGYVNATGNINSIQSYQYIDHSIFNGTIRAYYRIKQVDYNTNFKLTSIKVVNFGVINSSMSIYPNPFNDNIKIELNEELSTDAVMSVIDATGKVVLIQCFNKKYIEIDTKSLSSGIYTIQLLLNNRIENIKLIK